MILEIATVRLKIIFEHHYDLDTEYMKRVIDMYEVKDDSDRYDFILKTVKKKSLPSNSVTMEYRNNSFYYETENTFIFEKGCWTSTIFWDRKLMTTFFFKSNSEIGEKDDFLFVRSLKLLISLLILKRGGLPFHCSAVSTKNNRGIIFSGPSSTGKTYTARILNYKLKWKILNDEFNIIMPLHGSYHIYSTPFTSQKKISYCSYGTSLINCIYFLKKDNINKVKDIDYKKKYINTIREAYTFPTSDKYCILLMKNAEKICRTIPVKELYLNHKSNIATNLDTFLNLNEYL